MSLTIPCLKTFVQFGDNAAGNSAVPEYGICDSAGAEVASSHIVWDPAPSGGLISQWVAFELVANVGGGNAGIAWTVTGGVTVPLPTTAISYGTIDRVAVTAEVRDGGQRLAFRDVKVRFYLGNALKKTSTILQGNGPVADTLGQSNVTAEQSGAALPVRIDINRVIVTGEVQLELDDGITPLFDDLFGVIDVYTSSCNP